LNSIFEITFQSRGNKGGTCIEDHHVSFRARTAADYFVDDARILLSASTV